MSQDANEGAMVITPSSAILLRRQKALDYERASRVAAMKTEHLKGFEAGTYQPEPGTLARLKESLETLPSGKWRPR